MAMGVLYQNLFEQLSNLAQFLSKSDAIRFVSDQFEVLTYLGGGPVFTVPSKIAVVARSLRSACAEFEVILFARLCIEVLVIHVCSIRYSIRTSTTSAVLVGSAPQTPRRSLGSANGPILQFVCPPEAGVCTRNQNNNNNKQQQQAEGEC
jgi:hypothetical protein